LALIAFGDADENYLDRLVQDSDVVAELERHSKQYDETHPHQVERQMLVATSATAFQFNTD